ncbi:hypothetical protein PR048_031253 [Dryococelus australis]|uniref:Carboxylesterase type B domain-containing protein n=1 Tax=Dryococelus australis TaxID=614101 RepID=A0ABQ9G8U4_9NEOP|nr:hypothetical protein PR048_031253 [Dryococelus australis]
MYCTDKKSGRGKDEKACVLVLLSDETTDSLEATACSDCTHTDFFLLPCYKQSRVAATPQAISPRIPDDATKCVFNYRLFAGAPVVNVSQGSLLGKRVISRNTGEVIYSFQGIPYAQPPVGDLRFKLSLIFVLNQCELQHLLEFGVLFYAVVCKRRWSVNEEIWAAPEAIREYGAAVECKGGGNGSSPRKTPATSGVDRRDSHVRRSGSRARFGWQRVKAPRELESWSGIRNATAVGEICPQYDNGAIRGSEDCLFLNVFTPQLPSANCSSLLPVMLWIHGGGDFGSGNPVNYGPDLLVAKNVIVVTMNYRVGVLGLLNVRSSLSSQNNGLKDQVAALKWIQANIAQFGGDKNKVTIFGQSFGSSDVEFLMLSPMAKGLFRRAISHSGNALDRWAYIPPSRAEERAFNLGTLLGTTTNDGDELVRLLQTTPVAELLATQGNVFTDEDRLRSADIGFLVTKEELTAENTDIFLPDSPLNILKSGKYNKVPYITGFTVDDAKMAYMLRNAGMQGRGKREIPEKTRRPAASSVTIPTCEKPGATPPGTEPAYARNASLWVDIANNMEQFVPPELAIPLGSSESLALAAEIKELYFGDDTPTIDNIRGLIEQGGLVVKGGHKFEENLGSIPGLAPLISVLYGFLKPLQANIGCKLILAQRCTHSARAVGTSNQCGTGRNWLYYGHSRESGRSTHYTRDVTPTALLRPSGRCLGTDAFFIQGMRRSIHHRLKTSPTPIYVFQFSYVGNISLSEFCNYDYPFEGAAHTDDLCYLFWMHRIDATLSSTDRTVRDRMTTMWTNFAKTGNPNGHHGHLGMTWEPVTKTSMKYLNIDAKFTMHHDLKQLRPRKFAFWDRAYSRLDN